MMISLQVDLYKRTAAGGGKLGICTKAFVFHYKGFTLGQAPDGEPDSLNGYPQLTWVHTEHLSNHHWALITVITCAFVIFIIRKRSLAQNGDPR